jgi:ABC-type multidrug transport system fused ATPase/permease subunit
MYHELKWRYLQALMLKDVSWYDRQDVNQLPTEVYINLEAVERASGITVGFIMFSVSACTTGLIAAFYLGVYIGLLYSLIIPYVVVLVIYQNKNEEAKQRRLVKAYQKSGAHAEECLSSIKIVKAYGQEQYEVSKFESHLNKSSEASRQSWQYGLSHGLIESSYQFGRVFSFIIAVTLLLNGVKNPNTHDRHNGGDTGLCFFTLAIGCYYLGQSVKNINDFNFGRERAYKIYKCIEESDLINYPSKNSQSVGSIDSDIEFRAVSFSYQNSNKHILKNCSFTIEKGKMTAFVGPSG